MSKSYYSLGLMSGTSMDGVDASVIQTDGKSSYKPILDKYFEYPKAIYKQLTKLRDKIKSSKDLKKFSKEIKNVEKEITLFHAKAVHQILKRTKVNLNFIGFHGQTIYHNAKEKISKQLGDGKLLSKITKKTVVYDFRQNDLQNYGDGAPLAPIFHELLIKKFKIRLPVIILNIGGIANVTSIDKEKNMLCADIGPGNCLIDKWIRDKSKKKYDKNGKIAKSGKTSLKNIKRMIKEFEELQHSNESNGVSTFDVKDFDISYLKDLSLKDGAATITNFTGNIIGKDIASYIADKYIEDKRLAQWQVLVCGGGRKNKELIESIEKSIGIQNMLIDNFESIDTFAIDGDFVESQAFGYLAVRSYLKLPISFPETTGCKKPTTGGKIIKFK
tara:strand:+ start:15 stop:1175 length:1161 start_codon:yes stop_codon:yes gene_type:complete